MSAGRFVARVLTPPVLVTWAVLLLMLLYGQVTRPDPNRLSELIERARSEANEAASIARAASEGSSSTHYTSVAAESLRARVKQTHERLRTLRGVTGPEGRKASEAAAASHDVAKFLGSLAKIRSSDASAAAALVPRFETAFKDVPE